MEKAAGLEFLTGYLVEKSLSVDNIFVFLLIFQAFRVKAEAQHTVLFYGVAGALVMRAAFVLAGVELLQVFHSVLYVFGAFLLITGIRMFFTGERKIDPQSNWMVRAARRVMRIEDDPAIDTFFVKRNGPALRDASAACPCRCGGHGFDIRRGLGAGGARDHAQPVYRVLVERVRDPRIARALLCARGSAAAIAVPAPGACGDSDFCGSEDDRQRMAAGSGRLFAGRDRRDFVRYACGVMDPCETGREKVLRFAMPPLNKLRQPHDEDARLGHFLDGVAQAFASRSGVLHAAVGHVVDPE